MKLSDKLKSIFTSGDVFTVLQMLNKMIEEIEDYETSGSGEKLKVITHTVTTEEITQGSFQIDFGVKVATYMPITIVNTSAGGGEFSEVVWASNNIERQGASIDIAVIGKDSDDRISLSITSGMSAGDVLKVTYFEDTVGASFVIDV